MYFEVLGDFEVLRGRTYFDVLVDFEERLGDWETLGDCDVLGGIGRQECTSLDL